MTSEVIMTKSRFRVFDTYHGDHIAVIEMDEALLAPDVGMLHHETMTLRGIKNGGKYTLLPVDDHTVATLVRLREIFKNVTEKPAKLFSTSINRMDDLIQAVGLLFGDVTYVVVDSKDDLDKIINPPKDYEPKTVKYTVLGDMLTKAMADAGYTPDDQPATEHVHGPGCGH